MTETEYMHVVTASTSTVLVECTVAGGFTEVCKDAQGAEDPFFEFAPSGYWDYHSEWSSRKQN